MLLKGFTLVVCLFASSAAMAVIQQHTFTITGSGGEAGTGSFTWDDEVVADGQALSNFDLPPEVLSVSIDISGGIVVGGSTSFVRSDCTMSNLANTPDFTVDINFWCDNGVNNLVGTFFFTNSLNNGAASLTIAPGTTSPAVIPPIPTLSIYGLVFATLGLVIVGLRRFKALS